MIALKFHGNSRKTSAIAERVKIQIMPSPELHDAKSIKALLNDGRPQTAVEQLQFSAEQLQWVPVAFAARQLHAEIRGLVGEIWHPSEASNKLEDTEWERFMEKAIRLFYLFRKWEKDPQGQAQNFDTEHREKIDLFLLGMKERRSGKTSRAIKTFTRVIQKEPAFTEAYIERAALLMQQRTPDWEQALEDLNMALRISPNHPLALTNRGYLYVHFFKDQQQACKDWKAVQEMGFPIADTLIEQHCKN
jgi:tetratricopeptide (TPR) repeat protein